VEWKVTFGENINNFVGKYCLCVFTIAVNLVTLWLMLGSLNIFVLWRNVAI
jgi:hypothetical protein